MADYRCFPLWWENHPDLGHHIVDEDSIVLAPETRARLERWAHAFDRSLDWDNPPATTFSPDDWDAFDEEGRAILGLLRRELGSTYEIVSYDLGEPTDRA